MHTFYHKNIAPIEAPSDGRRFKRFVRQESVSLNFRGIQTTGNLVNLSPAGLFAVFPSQAPLPSVDEEVIINIDFDGKGNSLNLKGAVVRIQPPGEYEPPDRIGVAVDFRDLDNATKHRIRYVINYLLVKDYSYNT